MSVLPIRNYPPMITHVEWNNLVQYGLINVGNSFPSGPQQNQIFLNGLTLYLYNGSSWIALTGGGGSTSIFTDLTATNSFTLGSGTAAVTLTEGYNGTTRYLIPNGSNETWSIGSVGHYLSWVDSDKIVTNTLTPLDGINIVSTLLFSPQDCGYIPVYSLPYGTSGGYTTPTFVTGYSATGFTRVNVFCSSVNPYPTNSPTYPPTFSTTPLTDPILVIDQGLRVGKDVSAFGFLGTASDPQKGFGGGAILMGNGLEAINEPPVIDLTSVGYTELSIIAGSVLVGGSYSLANLNAVLANLRLNTLTLKSISGVLGSLTVNNDLVQAAPLHIRYATPVLDFELANTSLIGTLGHNGSAFYLNAYVGDLHLQASHNSGMGSIMLDAQVNVNGSVGSSGQILTSQGSNNVPHWTYPSALNPFDQTLNKASDATFDSVLATNGSGGLKLGVNGSSISLALGYDSSFSYITAYGVPLNIGSDTGTIFINNSNLYWTNAQNDSVGPYYPSTIIYTPSLSAASNTLAFYVSNGNYIGVHLYDRQVLALTLDGTGKATFSGNIIVPNVQCAGAVYFQNSKTSLYSDGNEILYFDTDSTTGGFMPYNDGQYVLGAPGHRWSTLYCDNGYAASGFHTGDLFFDPNGWRFTEDGDAIILVRKDGSVAQRWDAEDKIAKLENEIAELRLEIEKSRTYKYEGEQTISHGEREVS